MLILRKVFPALLVLCLILTWSAEPARAQTRRLSFIRDAEIEHTIRTYARPIFQAAGISPSAVKIYIVNSPSINAFVAGGQNLFVHTGLLLAAASAGEVIGVIAHEAGHIAGGHLARGQEELENARRTALLSTLLGLAATVAAGSGGAGAAVMSGGATIAERDFLSFTRSMENAADQAALTLLDRAGYSAEGLATFLERLEDQELVPTDRQVEYVRTHPLTLDRIDVVRNHVATSPNTGRPFPPAYDEMLARVKAKLFGFLSPQIAMRRYPPDDQSVAARYARAVAEYKRGAIQTAITEVDALIAQEPENPFFHELRGQMLLESGRLDEARPSYERAVALFPNEPTLLVPLAQTKIDSADPATAQSAVQDLEAAVAVDPDMPIAWRLLATAYGKAGDLGMAAVALAEEALARGDGETAALQADRALQTLPAGSPGALRAQDIQRAAEDLKDDD
jgi:predicted Zn-dependent protease